MIAKLFRFLLAGLPGFIIAVPLNYALVTQLHLPKPLAYILVLLCQVTVNFFACRRFVFQSAPGVSLLRQYTENLAGIGLFRVLDWVVYSVLVELFKANYLAVQFLNVVLFSLPKYKFAEQVFERRREGASPPR